MDAREQKGLALSSDKRIRNINGPTWAVPSQSDEASAYLVNVTAGTCALALAAGRLLRRPSASPSAR